MELSNFIKSRRHLAINLVLFALLYLSVSFNKEFLRPAMAISWIPWDNNETFLHDARSLDFAFSNLENPNPGPDGTPTCSLIRYLYDAVYREKYNNYLSEFISTVFTRETMSDKFLYYHMLIQGYVTGEVGESENYTLITDPSLFENSVNILNQHVNIKRNLALSYLDQGK